MRGRKLTPYCWATTISFTSARLLAADAKTSATDSVTDVKRKNIETSLDGAIC
jgi:hypothetical protein